MKRAFLFLFCFLISSGVCQAISFNGQGDNQNESLGYYYAITGGKFVNGQTVTGKKDTGGSMRFILDDPTWQDWGYNYAIDTWHTDGWFAETAGLALTMSNNGSVVYDNFNNDAGDFYTTPGQVTEGTPGMYRGYSMSNNYDWIYAGYFLLSEDTIIDKIVGYFDPNSGFDPDNPIFGYRMNIWSNTGTGTDIDPVNTGSFTGDIFSSDYIAGSFTWGDTGVDRVYGADYNYLTDDIYYMCYELDTPITLKAGEYWFSHDATINPVPEPATMLLLGSGIVGFAVIRRKKKK